MSDNVDNKNGMIHTWVISLAISVFCCALFFAFLSTYVGSISQSLTRIDERLANIEAQRLVAPPVPAAAPAAAPGQPPLGPFPTVIPPAAPAPAPVPEAAAPAPTPASVPAAAPAPVPEAATPNLPPVPAEVAPVSPEKK